MNNEIRRFRAPWSVYVWIITIAVLLVVVVVFCGVLKAICTGDLQNRHTQVWLFLVVIIPLLVLALVVLFAPIKYTITNSEIIVNRLGPNLYLHLKNVEEIRQLDKNELGFAFRLFGSGGFLGVFGLFYTSRLGVFNAYITNGDTLVFIKYKNGKKFLLSPEKPEKFLDAVAYARNHLSDAE